MKTKTLGFGFDPGHTNHYFSLHLSRGEGAVKVVERFDWQGDLPPEAELPNEA